MGDIEKIRTDVLFGAHGGIRAARSRKKLFGEIKWVDKVFYNNESGKRKVLKSGKIGILKIREDV